MRRAPFFERRIVKEYNVIMSAAEAAKGEPDEKNVWAVSDAVDPWPTYVCVVCVAKISVCSIDARGHGVHCARPQRHGLIRNIRFSEVNTFHCPEFRCQKCKGEFAAGEWSPKVNVARPNHADGEGKGISRKCPISRGGGD